MTEPVRDARDADDATLLNMVRTGDPSAFGSLYQRHQQAARRLARELMRTPAEVEGVVAEAFARVLAITRRGGGPTDAFRPYMLATLRQVSYERRRAQSSEPSAAAQPSDPGEPFTDPAVTELDGSMIIGAFLSLPERWRAVLWHLVIEGESPADVTALFGLSRNSVTALRDRALEGLRQAYLQTHKSRVRRYACKPVAARLGAFARDALSRRDVAMVTEHIGECADCRAACAELADIDAAVRGMVAPIFLGDVAASYLSGSGQASEAAAGMGTAGADTAAAAGGGAVLVTDDLVSDDPVNDDLVKDGPAVAATLSAAELPSQAGRVRHVPRQQRWLAAGAAMVVAGIAIGAWALTTGGTSTPHRPPGHQHAVADPVRSPTLQPSPTPSRSARKPAVAHKAHRSAPPAHTAPQPTGAPSPSPSPKAPPAVRLSATISVNSMWHWAQVVFAVTDTGKAGTAKLTATITLPSGASMMGGGGPGWTCQPVSSGATCQHAAISAGQQAQGTIFIRFGHSACGQAAEVTVKSGSASATAKSQGIQCHSHGGQ